MPAQDAHIARQAGVDAAQPGPLRAIAAGVEMHHLPERVHAGVGAPGSDHPDRLVGNAGQGLFEHRLHRRAVHLDLPAAVGAAVVFDAEGDPQNGGWRLPSGVEAGQQSGGLRLLGRRARALDFVVNLARRRAVRHADIGRQQVDLGVDRIAEATVRRRDDGR